MLSLFLLKFIKKSLKGLNIWYNKDWNNIPKGEDDVIGNANTRRSYASS